VTTERFEPGSSRTKGKCSTCALIYWLMILFIDSFKGNARNRTSERSDACSRGRSPTRLRSHAAPIRTPLRAAPRFASRDRDAALAPRRTPRSSPPAATRPRSAQLQPWPVALRPAPSCGQTPTAAASPAWAAAREDGRRRSGWWRTKPVHEFQAADGELQATCHGRLGAMARLPCCCSRMI